jgi:hypothetical protein
MLEKNETRFKLVCTDFFRKFTAGSGAKQIISSVV